MIIPKGTVVTIDGKVYRTLEAQVAWNKEELESLDIEALEALPDQFTELQENVSALGDSVADVVEDVGDLESDMSDAQSDISGLKDRMDSAESDIDQLEFDVDQVEGTISSIGTDLSSKQSKYLATVVTIEPSDWVLDQTNGFRATKTVAGVTSTNLVQVSPDVSSIDDYSDNNIVCDSQSSDELQFHAKDISAPPAMNILVNVVVWRN